MTETITIPEIWDNQRSTGAALATTTSTTSSSSWTRREDAPVSRYTETWDDQIPDDAFEADAAWRRADEKDLLALALWGIPLVGAIITAALL